MDPLLDMAPGFGFLAWPLCCFWPWRPRTTGARTTGDRWSGAASMGPGNSAVSCMDTAYGYGNPHTPKTSASEGTKLTPFLGTWIFFGDWGDSRWCLTNCGYENVWQTVGVIWRWVGWVYYCGPPTSLLHLVLESHGLHRTQILQEMV